MPFFSATIAALFLPLHLVSANRGASCDSGCSGHGKCGPNSVCACDDAWVGRSCDFFLGVTSSDLKQDVSLVESSSSSCLGGCSNGGRCVAGACACRPGFFGPTCADSQCPHGCLGHGACRAGKCQCHAGWMGLKCEMNAATRHVALAQGPSLAFRRAQDATASVRDASDILLQATQKMRAEKSRVAAHRLEAKRRIHRAISNARRNFDQLPAHEFGPRPGGASNVALLAKRNGLKARSAQKACSVVGCSGHGACASSGKCKCAQSWIGEFCDTKQCPSNCNGLGLCVLGKCVCGPHRFGESCEQRRCPADCSGHGYCFDGKCQCSGDYVGESCMSLVQASSSGVVRFTIPRKSPVIGGWPGHATSSLRASAGTSASLESPASVLQGQTTLRTKQSDACPRSCSDRGNCVKGVCLCFSGFIGRDCSKMGVCSGHGIIKAIGPVLGQTPKASMVEAAKSNTCSCDQGWTGTDCSVELVCPDQSCGGHGVCNYGKCVCGPGFSGHSCQISLVECSYRCGAHGTCVNGDSLCHCHEGWTGFRCEIEQAKSCPGDCSGHGVCMGGYCACTAPYTGPACDKTASLVAKSTVPRVNEKAFKPEIKASKDAVAKDSVPVPAKVIVEPAKPKPAKVENGPLPMFDTDDLLSGPMTSSWLANDSWILQAPPNATAPEFQEGAVDSTPLVAPIAALTKALPQTVGAKTGEAGQQRTLLSLLGARAETAPARMSVWSERPTEAASQVKLSDRVLPKKVASMIDPQGELGVLDTSAEEPLSRPGHASSFTSFKDALWRMSE